MAELPLPVNLSVFTLPSFCPRQCYPSLPTCLFHHLIFPPLLSPFCPSVLTFAKFPLPDYSYFLSFTHPSSLKSPSSFPLFLPLSLHPSSQLSSSRFPLTLLPPSFPSIRHYSSVLSSFFRPYYLLTSFRRRKRSDFHLPLSRHSESLVRGGGGRRGGIGGGREAGVGGGGGAGEEAEGGGAAGGQGCSIMEM